MSLVATVAAWTQCHAIFSVRYQSWILVFHPREVKTIQWHKTLRSCVSPFQILEGTIALVSKNQQIPLSPVNHQEPATCGINMQNSMICFNQCNPSFPGSVSFTLGLHLLKHPSSNGIIRVGYNKGCFTTIPAFISPFFCRGAMYLTLAWCLLTFPQPRIHFPFAPL